MTNHAKPASSWLAEAAEIACGWALGTVALYVVLFVDLTGNGSLWATLRAAMETEAPGAIVPVRAYAVPARPADSGIKDQNQMLMVPETPEKAFVVPVQAAARPRGR